MTSAAISEALSLLGAVAAAAVWIGCIVWGVRECWRLRRMQ